jgi:hypothetical protein
MRLLPPVIKENDLIESEPTALSKVQKEVVDHLLDNPKYNVRALAERVGCTREYVYKLLQLQHVKQYIIANARSELLLASGEAVDTIRKLLESKSDYIKLESAKDIQNRNELGNVGQVIGQTVQVKIDLS